MAKVFVRGKLMLHRLIIIAMMLLFGFVSGQAAAQEAIGAVSRIQGEAHGTRGGTTRALDLNVSVFLNEIVSTGEAARLEVTFIDDTRLTIGEKAKLTLDTYVFDPAAGSGTIKFGGDALRERQGPEDRPLPGLPRRGLEQLPASRSRGPVRPRRHPRRP